MGSRSRNKNARRAAVPRKSQDDAPVYPAKNQQESSGAGEPKKRSRSRAIVVLAVFLAIFAALAYSRLVLERDYRDAHAHDPSNPQTRLYLAQSCEKSGQPAKAVELLEQDLGLADEQQANRFIILGYAYRDLQDYPKAAETLRAGLQRFPDSPVILEDLAYLEYSQLQDFTNACEHFQRLLAVDPNNPKRDEYVKAVNYLAGKLGKSATGGQK